MGKFTGKVIVDGVTYVPEQPKLPTFKDCDGRNVVVGERVYVRQSVLGQYPNLTDKNRHGTLVSGDSFDSLLTIQFDGDGEFAFPRNQVRRHPVQ